MYSNTTVFLRLMYNQLARAYENVYNTVQD